MNDSMYELKLLMIYLILIKNEDKTCIRKKISSILKKINLYEDDDKIDKILSNLKADNLTSLLSEGTKLMNQYKNEMVNSQYVFDIVELLTQISQKRFPENIPRHLQ
mmetsp:Transcript_13509/g.20262  ORF Transcript_13509/g.20262 Transcript_13509/m.20262 type:complete len:107 (+) Transcript_13509:1299-1619(+)